MSKNLKSLMPKNWLLAIDAFIDRNFWQNMERKINEERKDQIIYPPSALTFSALEKCRIEDCKVIILGQDPYHGDGQANGLAFSVAPGIKEPPSLRNIFKELKEDYGSIPHNGDLSFWAEQGVLLINTGFTVRKDQANSHQNIGWNALSDAIIRSISAQKTNLVFILWGNHAQSKKEIIQNPNHHLILESVHPSPLSAHRGFFGSKPFSQANAYLKKNGLQPINWAV